MAENVRSRADPGLTYADAGVDISAAERAMRRITEVVRSASRPEVIGEIGGFAGLFSLKKWQGYSDPVLVATTDGVGTKATVARMAARFSTIGIDLVAMCVDDLVCVGAEPLFLLDYVAVGRLDVDWLEALVGGLAEGCRQAGCALIGGETAEHPGAMEAGSFDLAGFAVGIVERDRYLDRSRVQKGDALIGLLSPGLRCNGYSLARRVLLDEGKRSLEDRAYPGAAHSLADELLLPSLIYAPAMGQLLREVDVHAAAHVTGGGIPGNLSRVLPSSCDAMVQRSSWETPAIFGEIQRVGQVSSKEMERVFNLGIGMIVAVARAEADLAVRVLGGAGRKAVVVGGIEKGEGRVRMLGR